MSLPYQIEQMAQQIGSGLLGGFNYVGAGKKYFNCRYPTGGANSTVKPNGSIEAPVALIFGVNGKRGAGWKFIVNIEASDTYNVYLWRPSKISAKKYMRMSEQGEIAPIGIVMDSATDIYCDQLQGCIERMYDKAIKEHNGGFINLG